MRKSTDGRITVITITKAGASVRSRARQTEEHESRKLLRGARDLRGEAEVQKKKKVALRS